MSSLAGISSSIIKNKIPLYYFKTSSTSTRFSPLPKTFITSFPLAKWNLPNDNPKHVAFGVHNTYQCAQNSTEFPGKSPPEFPQAPPPEEYSVPLEIPQTPNVPDFDPIPPEKPADLPPLSPEEFPGPPNPSPPKPEAPTPPLSPPEQPEIVPPHGPEIVPSQPPDPGPPIPTQADIPTLV